MAGKGGQSTASKRLNAIQINQSAYGNCVPLGYGKNRAVVTLIWYDDFASQQQDAGGGKGGGKGSTGSTTYSASIMAMICEGPIAALGNVYLDKEVKTLASLGFTLFTGASGQAPWSYLTSAHPSVALGYDLTAYLAGQNIDLGSSAGLPNVTVEAFMFTPFNLGTIDDAEPSDILLDYTTDPNHGCAFPYLDTGIQGVGVTTYESYCISQGFFISPLESTQRAAADFISEILKITNSECVWSASKLRIVPYATESSTGNGRTYTPDLTPQYDFGDDDYYPPDGEEPVTTSRVAQDETFNVVRVEYLDRLTNYNTAIAEASDEQDIALNGKRPMQTLSYHGIIDGATARAVAQHILQRQLYIRNTYSFRVRSDFCLLEPLDYVTITDSFLGLSRELVRITEIEDDEENNLRITAEEVAVGAAGAARYQWDASQGFAANYAVDPGNVIRPFAAMVPTLLQSSPTTAEMWLGACGGPNWGGCDVWMSLDNITYAFIGTISKSARSGLLTANLADTASNPDVTNTLAIHLDGSGVTLIGGTQADADNLRALAYVDGEIVAFENATLTGTNAYSLTYMRRGVYGSQHAFHANGSVFCRIDGALLRIPIDKGLLGQTVNFKFPSFNIYGLEKQSLASVSPVSKVLSTVAGTQQTFRAFSANVSLVNDVWLKTDGVNATWDAQVYSLDGYTECFADAVVSSLTAHQMFGLSSNPSSTADYTGIDYAMYNNAGTLSIYEAGTGIANYGSLAVGDMLQVVYDGLVVRYKLNGTVIRGVPAYGKKLFLDSSFYDLQSSQWRGLGFGQIAKGGGIGNFLDTDAWTVGAGSVRQGGYSNYGTTLTVLGGVGGEPLGPYGSPDILIKGGGVSTAAVEGGIYNAPGLSPNDIHGINPANTYRACVWVRYTGASSGNIYFTAADDATLTRQLGGTGDSAGVFVAPLKSALTINKWYLFVGFIHGATYGTTPAGLGGVYDPVSGKRVLTATEFKLFAGKFTQGIRCFGYNGLNAAGFTYFARPRFEVVNGREPSLATLLSPTGALAYLDLADTANLAANSATLVQSTSIAGPTTLSPNNTYSVGTLTFLDPGVNCTVSVRCTFTGSSASANAYNPFLTFTQGATTANSGQLYPNGGAPVAETGLSLNASFNVVGGGGNFTVALGIKVSSTTAIKQMTYQNLELIAEMIKR